MMARVNSIVLRRWHRRAGIFACLFLLLLAVSGLVLNRSEELGLDQRFISSPSILGLFGIHSPELGPSFKVGEDYFVQFGDRIYRNGVPLISEDGVLIGAIANPDYVLIATQSPALLLLNEEGELVERLGAADGLPKTILRMGINDSGAAVLESAAGLVDLRSLRWERDNIGEVTWALAERPHDSLVQQIITVHRGHGLSVERALLELHSGRIAGETGRLLVDITGIISIVLALSGLLIWCRGRFPPRP
jgi:hypothetical protein